MRMLKKYQSSMYRVLSFIRDVQLSFTCFVIFLSCILTTDNMHINHETYTYDVRTYEE